MASQLWFLGDSNTGNGYGPWVDKYEARAPAGWTVRDLHVGGQFAAQSLAYTQTQVGSFGTPTVAFCCWGGAEALSSSEALHPTTFPGAPNPPLHPASGAAADCIATANYLTGLGTRVILAEGVGSISTQVAAESWTADQIAWAKDFIGFYATIGAGIRAGWAGDFLNLHMPAKARYWTTDHIHVDTPGSRAMADRWYGFLKRKGIW